MSDSLIYDMSLGSEETEVPFLSKQLIYINDNNASQKYSTHEIIWDSLSIGSNGKYNSLRQGYLAIPLVISVTCGVTAGGAVVDLSALNSTDFLVCLKNSNLNLISSLMVEYNNTPLVTTQQNLNAYLIFKQHVSMSANDVNNELIGYNIDEPTSWQYNNATDYAGHGLCNNVCGESYQPAAASHNGKLFNEGMMKRSQVFVNPRSAFGRDAIYTKDVLLEKNQNVIFDTATEKTYHYTAILRLRDIHSLFDNMPLVRGANLKITLRINQGYFEVTRGAAGQLNHDPTKSILPNGTCPIMVSANSVNITSCANAFGATAAIAVSTGDMKYPSGSATVPFSSILKCSVSVVSNIWGNGTSNQIHKLTNARLYLPSYVLQTDYEKQYLALGQRTVKYIDTFYKAFENQPIQSDVQIQITSSCVNPKRLIIIPMINKEVNSDKKIRPMASPFDTSPSTTSPYSMTNVQCFISGNPIYHTQQNYTFETFTNELNNFGLNSNENTGLSSGLITYKHFSNNYNYIVIDLSRKLPEDSNTSVSIDFAFRITSLKALDLFCYVEQEKSITINLLNGSLIKV